MILISPCYFNFWMVASYVKYENLLLTLPTIFRENYESPRTAAFIL